ncbi:MAG: ribonuclease P protein component [Pseudomonadales bacterium]
MQHSTAQRATAQEGFPRQARLTRADEFERVLRHPEFKLRSGPLRLNAVFNRMQCARLGLVVGKKAVPPAHARNRIKRIVRDRFRRTRSLLGSLDMVIRVTGPLRSADLDMYLEHLFTGIVEYVRENVGESSREGP